MRVNEIERNQSLIRGATSGQVCADFLYDPTLDVWDEADYFPGKRLRLDALEVITTADFYGEPASSCVVYSESGREIGVAWVEAAICRNLMGQEIAIVWLGFAPNHVSESAPRNLNKIWAVNLEQWPNYEPLEVAGIFAANLMDNTRAEYGRGWDR